MEFINIPTALFSSPEYIGAEPIQRATWISLLAWCCEQENGGLIEGCRASGIEITAPLDADLRRDGSGNQRGKRTLPL